MSSPRLDPSFRLYMLTHEKAHDKRDTELNGNICRMWKVLDKLQADMIGRPTWAVLLFITALSTLVGILATALLRGHVG